MVAGFIRRLFGFFVAAAAIAIPMHAAPPAEVGITRLDCCSVQANNLDLFSDTMAYVGQSRMLTVSCYLVRHGDDYLLWDPGLPASVKGAKISASQPLGATYTTSILEHLATLGVKPERIRFVAASHYHFDHIGQAADFPKATLLIGEHDWKVLSSGGVKGMADPAMVTPWLTGGSKVEPVKGDKDVFGDGSVMMINLPGHTPGHHGLLVRLKQGGPMLLTGDLAHFTENYESNGIPAFNADRAASLASLDRFKKLAANLKATVIIQHEPRDIAKLPPFPKEAR